MGTHKIERTQQVDEELVGILEYFKRFGIEKYHKLSFKQAAELLSKETGISVVENNIARIRKYLDVIGVGVWDLARTKKSTTSCNESQNEELLARLEQGLLALKKIPNFDLVIVALEIRLRKLEQAYEIDIGHLQGRVRKLEESKQKTERYHETHSQNS